MKISDAGARDAMDAGLLAAARGDTIGALDAWRKVSEYHRAGYRLSTLADPENIKARAVAIRARYDGSCAACAAPHREGETVLWTRDASGVLCGECAVRR